MCHAKQLTYIASNDRA